MQARALQTSQPREQAAGQPRGRPPPAPSACTPRTHAPLAPLCSGSPPPHSCRRQGQRGTAGGGFAAAGSAAAVSRGARPGRARGAGALWSVEAAPAAARLRTRSRLSPGPTRPAASALAKRQQKQQQARTRVLSPAPTPGRNCSTPLVPCCAVERCHHVPQPGHGAVPGRAPAGGHRPQLVPRGSHSEAALGGTEAPSHRCTVLAK